MDSNKRGFSIGQLIIDLTPLLDVVLILLVVVLARSREAFNTANDTNRRLAEEEQIISAYEVQLNDEIDHVTDMYTAASEHINSSENMYEYVNLVTIYASYKESDRKNRTVYVFVNSEQKSWPVTRSNEATVWDEVKVYLEDALMDYSTSPTFFSIKYDVDMLYRDEEQINRIREELETEFSGLYDMPYTEMEHE